MVANGITWNLAGNLRYYSDSDLGDAHVAPWDEATGSMGTARLFASSSEAEGRQRGLTATFRP